MRTLAIAILLLCSTFVSEPAHGEDGLFVVHFATGSAWDTTRAPNEQTGFDEHSANLSRLRSDGVIVFGGRYDVFGMIILRDSSLEAATKRIASDPGVRRNLFTYTIAPLSVFYPWKE
jgi:hypothetical protein